MHLLGAMGPPGGGRMVISRRLQSRFNMINMTFPQVSKYVCMKKINLPPLTHEHTYVCFIYFTFFHGNINIEYKKPPSHHTILHYTPLRTSPHFLTPLLP